MSFDLPEVIYGNYIGDFVKGKQVQNYPKKVQAGLYLHRWIDSTTDQKDTLPHCKAMIREKFGKFSSIILDMFIDHYLAKNWSLYSNESLQSFQDRNVKLLLMYKNEMHAHPSRFLDYIIEKNLFVNYANLNTINDVLNGIAHRLSVEVDFKGAVDLYSLYEKELNVALGDFYPEFMNMAKAKLNELLNNE